MSDRKKFTVLISATAFLAIFIMLYSMAQDLFLPGIEDYARRRIYYERVTSKKGLSLHKGMYWKEKE